MKKHGKRADGRNVAQKATQLVLFRTTKNPPSLNLPAKKLRQNIARLYRRAEPLEVTHGKNWYRDAHDFAQRIAVEYRLPIAIVARVIAALSPASRWDENKRAAKALLAEEIARVEDSGSTMPRTCGTYRYKTYGKNVEKARELIRAFLCGSHLWATILRGNKVNAFARNIEFPNRSEDVTVDFHALSVAFDYRWTTKTCPRISDRLYQRTAVAYAAVAREKGLTNHALQAIVWLVQKRIHRV